MFRSIVEVLHLAADDIHRTILRHLVTEEKKYSSGNTFINDIQLILFRSPVDEIEIVGQVWRVTIHDGSHGLLALLLRGTVSLAIVRAIRRPAPWHHGHHAHPHQSEDPAITVRRIRRLNLVAAKRILHDDFLL